MAGTPVEELGARAKIASRHLATASTEAKDAALHAAADLLEQRADEILAANADDVAREEAGGMAAGLLDRLRLSRDRIAGMAGGLRQVAALPLPSDVAAWDVGAELARGAQLASDAERPAALRACAETMCVAYDDHAALDWWVERARL